MEKWKTSSEDNLQKRQPQYKITFNNWKSARHALKIVSVNSCKAQHNVQLFEKVDDDLQGR